MTLSEFSLILNGEPGLGATPLLHINNVHQFNLQRFAYFNNVLTVFRQSVKKKECIFALLILYWFLYRKYG